VEGGESAKYFYPCWDGDNYCCGCEVGSCVYVYPDGKHVMGSYNEAEEADSHYCSDHAYVPEWFFFARVVSNNVGNYSKAWEDEDVYFRMSEESE